MIDKDGEVRELTAEDLKLFKKTSLVLPEELLSVLPKRGRPKKESPKVSTTIRLNPDVLEFFKSHGRGWQTKVNEVLSQYVAKHR
ncbi:MAG: BrnA antitoxin family protein [Proteobacteria bacterium]|nr:BrnA antitoxin family protein [Pseudomonadota bacterium]